MPLTRMPTSKDDVVHFANQDFDSIKADLLQKELLFEDPEFEASNKLLAREKRIYTLNGKKIDVEWLRPDVSEQLTTKTVTTEFCFMRNIRHVLLRLRDT